MINDFAPAYTLTIGELRSLIREELKCIDLEHSPLEVSHVEERWLNIRALCKHINVSRPHLYKLRKSGMLPKPTFVGKSPRWLMSEVDEMLSKKKK